MTLATDAKFCDGCGTRIITAAGADQKMPALNWGQDPAGKVAVTFTHPRTARWLARGEDAGPLEHRHSVHECRQVEQ